MPNYICQTCGTQYAESSHLPERCLICEDERQYVKPSGQSWTTLAALRKSHRNSLRFEEPGLIGIGTDPHFGIGQRALFLKTPEGNILWDCVPLIDEAVVEAFRAMGGIQAIAISHPHYYSSMVEWSRAFDDVPIYLHADDRRWVMRPDDAVIFWEGETHDLLGGLTLIRCGDHFPGGTVLHWPSGTDGKGVLLSGDIIQVVADRRYVSFMWSYPNYIPLSAPIVQQIVQAVESIEFDRIYGAFWDAVIRQDGKEVVRRSAERYLRMIGISFVGDARQAIVLKPTDGKRIGVAGDVYRFLATQENTNGRYAIWEATVPPGGGPPLHVHSREDEGFYVLDGEITFHAEDQTVIGTAGTFLNLPPGVRHCFRNESQRTARMLIFVSPAGLERMFQETGTILNDSDKVAPPLSSEEIDRLVSAAPRYGITIFPPNVDQGA